MSWKYHLFYMNTFSFSYLLFYHNHKLHWMQILFNMMWSLSNFGFTLFHQVLTFVLRFNFRPLSLFLFGLDNMIQIHSKPIQSFLFVFTHKSKRMGQKRIFCVYVLIVWSAFFTQFGCTNSTWLRQKSNVYTVSFLILFG